MKQFDIELAKKKHPVQTRDGRPVTILCFDRKDSLFPIVALVPENEDDRKRETVVTYTTEGKACSACDTNSDLFMVTNKKEGWINVYKNNVGTVCSQIFGSKEDAEEAKSSYSKLLVTKKIEWEE